MSNWTLQVDADRIAWLTADMAGSSANVLSGDMVRELAAKLFTNSRVASPEPSSEITTSSGQRVCRCKPRHALASDSGWLNVLMTSEMENGAFNSFLQTDLSPRASICRTAD